MNHPNCPSCGWENDTDNDICAVCTLESELCPRREPIYDGATWDELYESLGE